MFNFKNSASNAKKRDNGKTFVKNDSSFHLRLPKETTWDVQGSYMDIYASPISNKAAIGYIFSRFEPLLIGPASEVIWLTVGASVIVGAIGFVLKQYVV